MSAAINRGVLLKTRATPSNTVDSGEAYFWLEGQTLKYKDDTQTTYSLATGVSPEEVQDIIGAFITSGNNRITAVYNDAGDSFVITLVEANIAHQNLSGAGTNTHAQIDTHIANTSNPHSVTAAQIGIGGTRVIKSGEIPAASFTGTPRTFTLNFGTAFPTTNYSLIVLGGNVRTWSYQSKTTSSIIINSNANAALSQPVLWIAIDHGESIE